MNQNLGSSFASLVGSSLMGSVVFSGFERIDNGFLHLNLYGEADKNLPGKEMSVDGMV